MTYPKLSEPALLTVLLLSASSVLASGCGESGDATDVWASSQLDTKYYWNSLAYAYEMTGDVEFLDKAAEMAGVGNLFNHMHGNAAADVGNRGMLVALLQELNGVY